MSQAAAANPLKRVVCHLIERLDYGGAETLVHSLATGLRDSGYRPIVCVLQPGALADRLEGHGVRVHCLNLQRHSILEGPAFALFVTRLVRGLARLVKAEGVSVIHAHMPDAIIWAACVGRLTGTAVVGTYHGLGNLPRGRSPMDPRNALRRRLYRAAASSSDRTIAVSPAVRQWLCGEMGFDERKTVLLMNGVETKAFARQAVHDDDGARAQLGLAGRTIVVCVGRLVPGKGHRYLIEAMARVCERYPNAALLLVGDGPERPSLERQVHELNLSGSVRFAGQRSDVMALLGMSSLFVLPSFSEGIPIALIEAMAAGKPVVATAIAGNLDVVVDDRFGLLVPSGDAQALADAVCTVLADPDRAAQMAERGQARMRASFDIEQSIAATTALYEEVLAERSLRRRAAGGP
jgi:glycosyltransferase involved in cell wall biosynthesis